MLSLQRYKGERVYIGDEELTVLGFDDFWFWFSYLGQPYTIKVGTTFNPSPNVTIRYLKLSRNQARFQISSPLPIYRGEIYEQRNSKSIT